MLLRDEENNTIIKAAIENRVYLAVLTTVISDKLRCIYESHIRQCPTPAIKSP